MDAVTQYILGWNAAAVICLVVGMLLMVYEMFTPGMGVPALLGGISLLAAIILRADSLGTALITTVLILVPLIVGGALVFRSFAKGALSRSPIVLKDSIEEKATSLSTEEAKALIGLEGVCTTALRPAGNGEFDGKRLDILSEGGFVPKGARVKIVGIDGLKILVKEI